MLQKLNGKKIIGIDIGGTHITAAQINMNDRCVVEGSGCTNVVKTNGVSAEIIDVWVQTIKQVINHLDKKEVLLGISMPRPFDYENGISKIKGMNKYDALYNMDIRHMLSKELEIMPSNILFRNDAESFLHGEVNCGAAMNKKNAFGITLGTGLGSAVSECGFIHDANLGSAPFKRGIAEDYLSTRWFLKRYYELTGENIPDVKTLVEDNSKRYYTQIIFNEFKLNLADFLWPVILKYKPEIVVIGGNIARASALFLNQLQALLNLRDLQVILRRTALWEEAAMIGVAYYWKDVAAEKIISLTSKSFTDY
ncbi:ROK family protein [Pedobacter rhodius]|uniref:ROK family protein n=1 Tax=Pedobacter rhodius TaxID=3004098 RepID=A0ABT4KXM3_9SPHI|nr:ROK family protein [Pedobacter sp. SJ11]MCZ4223486.1 ROK family protein [Pedobacter sp. SJ11]